jgi:hypothetical protein
VATDKGPVKILAYPLIGRYWLTTLTLYVLHTSFSYGHLIIDACDVRYSCGFQASRVIVSGIRGSSGFVSNSWPDNFNLPQVFLHEAEKPVELG